MFEVVLASIILASAFLAIYYKQIIYSVVSLTGAFLAVSTLYFYLGAYYAAVFQLVTGIGTCIVFLLVGRTLSPPRSDETALKKAILGVSAILVFSVPILVGVGQPETMVLPRVSTVPRALWNARVLDVLAQGLVVLTIALGAGVILTEEGGE